MSDGPARLWRAVVAPLAGVDRFFFLLRAATVAAGLLWILILPHPGATAPLLRRLFLAYVGFSALLYAVILARPQVVRQLYLVALGVDMAFVYVLVRYVGELRGSFFIAFYLLTSIAAFYFGRRVGLLAAGVASALYVQIYVVLGGPQVLPWPELILRLGFLFLLAVSLGLLAERERADREKMARLNRELQHRNQILEQAYQHLSIGRLAGDIAQQVNNPTGIVAGRAELLLREARELGLPAQFVRGLEVIARHAYQVGAVSKTLLAFARPAAFELKPVNLNEVAEEALLLMDGALHEHKIELRRRLEPRLPLILGDAGALRGVVVSLLTNAVDAMPHGGTLEVVTRARNGAGEGVECAIRDDGPGIAPEHQDRIFDPFFTTKGPGGVGLGLSTSLRIMQRHNGLIEVRSRPGEGTTFILSFPPSRP